MTEPTTRAERIAHDVERIQAAAATLPSNRDRRLGSQPVATDHLIRAKAAELAWHPVHRQHDHGLAITALVAYAENELDVDLDREQADGYLTAETTARPIYKPARHPDEVNERSLAQSLLAAEADARGWLAREMTDAEREGNLIRAMTLRQVRAELAVLGLISGH